MPPILKDARFTLRRAVFLSLWVIRVKFFPFLILSLLAFSPLLPVLIYFPEFYLGEVWETEANSLTVFEFFLSVLIAAILVNGTVSQLTGDRHVFTDSEIDRVALAPPVLLTCILFSLGMTVGFTLLIVPGLVLTVIWWVAIPAAVIERPGVLRSFGRSLELTKGHRWKILAVFLLVAAVGAACQIGATAALAPDGIWSFSGALPHESTYPAFTPFLIGSWIVGAVTAAFQAVLIGVSYVLLRMEKERADMAQAVAAFD